MFLVACYRIEYTDTHTHFSLWEKSNAPFSLWKRLLRGPWKEWPNPQSLRGRVLLRSNHEVNKSLEIFFYFNDPSIIDPSMEESSDRPGHFWFHPLFVNERIMAWSFKLKNIWTNKCQIPHQVALVDKSLKSKCDKVYWFEQYRNMEF